MTRNRNRKDKIRQSRQNTGTRHAAAARQVGEWEQRSCQIHELLTEATSGIRDTDLEDITDVLQHGWTVVCLIGAATEILAACADADDYRPRRLLAQQRLAAAVSAMHATPALRGAPSSVNPAGGPDDRLTGSAADVIRDALTAACDVLEQMMTRVPRGVRPPSAARACAVAAESARRISGIYRAPRAAKPSSTDATSRTRHVQAVNPSDLQAVISDHLDDLSSADPHDTTEMLAITWYGFGLVGVLGEYLALGDPDAAVLHQNAVPVLARVTEAMEAAPSLPSCIHGIVIDIPAPDPQMATVARRGIWDLTLAINALLPQARCHARHEADQLVAQACTALAAELADCYQGRLRTFLNPYGREPGTGSAFIRRDSRSARRSPTTRRS